MSVALASGRAPSLEETTELAAVRVEWTRLAERAGNVFSTWEWADAWHRHLANGAELSIGVARDSHGEAIAILPLCLVRRRPVRLARFIGAGVSDLLRPVCAPADLPTAVDLLRRHVNRMLGGSGIFLAEHLPGDERFAAELGGTAVYHVSCPVLPLAGRTFEQFLAGRSRNFREQVRGRMRKAAREGFTFRLTVDPATLRADMDTLIRLHRARWSGGESKAFEHARSAFHHDFAARALERGWLRLWTMEFDETPVAAWLGLRYADTEFFYQSGRDPAYDRWNVGFVLLCHSISCAFADGMRSYSFGLGPEPYKYRFAEHDAGVDTVAVASGATGRLALAAIRAGMRLPKSAQRFAFGLAARG